MGELYYITKKCVMKIYGDLLRFKKDLVLSGKPSVLMTLNECTVKLLSNFSSCSARLCEGISQILRKDDSCDSTLAI